MKIVGFDPSLNNWGVAEGNVDMESKAIQIDNLSVISPVIPKGKKTRQNSKDILAATQLAKEAKRIAEGASIVFVEVPHGSQSARAMASYGICVGVLGALQATGMSLIQVTALEVKLIAGSKKSSKQDMIEWATEAYPNAPWPYYMRRGEKLISGGKAEHMADACAAISAGMKSDDFERLLSLFRNMKP